MLAEYVRVTAHFRIILLWFERKVLSYFHRLPHAKVPRLWCCTLYTPTFRRHCWHFNKVNIFLEVTLVVRMLARRPLFSSLVQHDMKPKRSKYKLCKSSVMYLGHVVSEQSIATDHDKMFAIKDWPKPHNVKINQLVLQVIHQTLRKISTTPSSVTAGPCLTENV